MQNTPTQTRTLAQIAGLTAGATPAPLSDVQAQLTHLEDSVCRLDAVALNVLNRLAPVLRPAVPQAAGKSDCNSTLPATELATQISTLTSRVDSVRTAIADAYERLGI